MFYVEFLARFLRSILGRLEEKYDWKDLTISIPPVRNNFVKKLFMTKSRQFKSLFFIEQASRVAMKHAFNSYVKFHAKTWNINISRRGYSASALLTMQTTVIARAILSVRPSQCFVQMNEDTIVRIADSGRTIILERKLIQIFSHRGSSPARA